MPLDILISDQHDRTIKSIPLFLKDYDHIMECIENSDKFSILNNMLSDYYGEGEVYLIQLPELKSEVIELIALFRTTKLDETKAFLKDFHELVEFGIEKRKAIKFIGD